MNAELKSLIEDAAKLLGYTTAWLPGEILIRHVEGKMPEVFNPLDPERGDLMKVAMAAKLALDLQGGAIMHQHIAMIDFTPDDHDSLALAVLRAASAVLKARNGNAE